MEQILLKPLLFSRRTYVGDPLNVVQIFNDLNVDELVLFDIDASVLGVEPNYSLLRKLATVSRMPLCYGGGIKNVSQFDRIISLGIEKVSISSSALEEPNLITSASSLFGSRSVVVTLDIKKRSRFSRQYTAYTHNGSRRSSVDLVSYCSSLRQLGAGELLINSISCDGSQKGYDIDLLNFIYPLVDLPMTVLGGASSFQDISSIIRSYPYVSTGAGSIFIFHGKFKAVLISYPDTSEKYNIFEAAGLF